MPTDTCRNGGPVRCQLPTRPAVISMPSLLVALVLTQCGQSTVGSRGYKRMAAACDAAACLAACVAAAQLAAGHGSVCPAV